MFNKSTIFLSMVALFAVSAVKPARYGDWQNKEIQSMSFSSNFQFGTTSLAYEVEGNSINNSWQEHEQYKRADGSLFSQELSGIACDSWNRYKEDIQLMKEAGLTVFCFSIDWSKIEPSQGCFDAQALQHYADVCDELNRNGIEPLVILKDYRDPIWFINCGGFEKEYNIAFFEQYCLTVFEALQGKAYKFITFWTPESYAMLAYWNKSHPPFKKNMQLAIDVLKNELEAHVRVYNSLKAVDTAKEIQIGIAKHVIQLEPRYPWDRLACSMANILTNDLFYNFFTTGKFDVSIRTLPAKWGGVVKHYSNALAPHSVDFIGINYHCHSQMRNFKRIPFINERKTDIKSITVDPKGLFYAIEEVSNKMARKLNIPIIITQNGIATTDDDLRILHTEFNLCSVSEAIKYGHNVQGYCYYSLLDGFSWGEYGNKFGLFSVNRTTMERMIKPGALRFIEIVKKHTDVQA